MNVEDKKRLLPQEGGPPTDEANDRHQSPTRYGAGFSATPRIKIALTKPQAKLTFPAPEGTSIIST